MTEEEEALPPLAELVSDEDVEMALRAYDQGPLEDAPARMRLALEAYGRRLVARIGGTG